MGRVAGSTLANGWTHAGYFKEIDYGTGDTSAEAAAGEQQTGTKRITLRRGSKGAEVRALQEMLNALAYGLTAFSARQPKRRCATSRKSTG